MRRVLWCSLLAACGSRPPPPPTDLPTLDDHRVASGDAAAETPAKTGGLSPELINAVGGRTLVIQPLTSLKLGAAERLVAQQRIAAWASADGLKILPPADVERAIERAAAGLDATTGKACGPPLDREYAMERWVTPMGAQGTITPRIDCREQCTLQLEIMLYGLGTEFYSAPFDPSQPWDAELQRRLPEVVDNGGHERYGHANNPVAIAGVPRTDGANDWYFEEGAITNRVADAATSKACGIADHTVLLLLDRDAKGNLHCERAASPGSITEYAAAINDCMCAIAVKAEHPTTARSYVAYTGPQPAPIRSTKNGKQISAMVIGGNEYRPDGTAPWFMRGDESIAECFVARTDEVEPKEASATLEFDGKGAVSKVTIGDPTGLFKPDERTCITKKLKTIVTPCPTTPAKEGTVRLTLDIHKPYGEK